MVPQFCHQMQTFTVSLYDLSRDLAETCHGQHTQHLHSAISPFTPRHQVYHPRKQPTKSLSLLFFSFSSCLLLTIEIHIIRRIGLGAGSSSSSCLIPTIPLRTCSAIQKGRQQPLDSVPVSAPDFKHCLTLGAVTPTSRLSVGLISQPCLCTYSSATDTYLHNSRCQVLSKATFIHDHPI